MNSIRRPAALHSSSGRLRTRAGHLHPDLLTAAAGAAFLIGAFIVSMPLIRLGWHPLLAVLSGLGLTMAGLFALAGLSSAVAALRRALRRLRPGERVRILHGPNQGRSATVLARLPDGGTSVILDDGDPGDPPVDVLNSAWLEKDMR